MGRTSLRYADLSWADLKGAQLFGADLDSARLRGTDLRDADLRQAVFVLTDMAQSDLRRAHVFGASVWRCDLSHSRQQDLVITDFVGEGGVTVTVDNIEVAQFVYLLLRSRSLRDVIDTITSKVVLLLGRFSPKQKRLLDHLRAGLRRMGYVPLLFDFERPVSRDFTETIGTLAHLARFIIVDITDARSVPQELEAIIPRLRHVPVQPLLRTGGKAYGLFADYSAYPWVLPIVTYGSSLDLSGEKVVAIVRRAEVHARRLIGGTKSRAQHRQKS
jgi:hypothetical protein